MPTHEHLLDRVFHAARPVFGLLIAHPVRFLVAGVVATVLGLLGTSQLSVDSDLSKLIPSHYPSVQALEKLRQSIGGESEAAVVIESPSFDANRRFAEALIPRALALHDEHYADPLFTYAEFRRETSFIENNALYFATAAELDSLSSYLDRESERAHLEANPFYFELDEDDDSLDSLGDALIEEYRNLIGTEYPISVDSLVMAVRFYPSGSQTDIDFIRVAYKGLQSLVDSLQPASFHPQMEVTLAGRLLRQQVEIEAITSDVEDTFLTGVALLLLVVVGYFFYKGLAVRTARRARARTVLREFLRTPAIAVLIGLPLLAAEACTFGIAYLAYGTLNIMTSTLGLVLFGLGIDFGIHVYARYAEERGRGRDIAEAMDTTIQTTGQAVTVVAITTAAAFYVLMLADFKGFSEFGFVAGNGIVLGLLAMTLLLPALLVLFDRLRFIDFARTEYPTRGISEVDSNSGHESRRQTALARWVVLAGILATLISGFALTRVAFEYDFGRLEPVYEKYNTLSRKVRLVYSDRKTRNAAYVLVDSPEEADAVAAALRNHAAVDSLTPTIRSIETLQDRFPMSDIAIAEKLGRIAAIRDKLEDATISAQGAEDISLLRRAASTRDAITLEDVPDFLKHPFTTKRGGIGHVVIIYPSVSLSDGRNSMAFADDVGTIRTANGKAHHAGSTTIVAADMLRLMQKEAPLMVALILILIVAFKFIILGRPRWVLLALTPLAASFIWMFGLMEFIGLKLTFYNLVVLPTVLGIGDDSGIHIVHRYLEEGRGSLRRVLRSTGEHVTVSTLTTIFGFGGLMFSMHPGMRSIGYLAIIGIGSTWVASLVLLPAIIYLLERGTRRASRHPRGH